MTINELLKELGDPEGERPPAPPWHVDSRDCNYGWIMGGDPPKWQLCNCEDPANPWPARIPGDGPRDCSCYACMDHEPRWQRGKLAGCEYKNHHCLDCHENNRCTAVECNSNKL